MRADISRRRVLRVAALGVAAFESGFTKPALSESGRLAVAVLAPSSSRLEPLRQLNAGVLNIAFHEDGPAEGPAVMLMHGFPYDIHSYVDVAPMLAAKGSGLSFLICGASAPPVSLTARSCVQVSKPRLARI
jgi:hypothetical protein